MKISEIATGIQHIGIPTNNINQTIQFYEDIGFEVTYVTINEASGEHVAFLQMQNLVVETYQNGCAVEKAGAIDHVAINVTDIDIAYKLAQNMNWRMMDDAIQFLPFWENGVKFFTIEGFNGEKVEFSQML